MMHGQKDIKLIVTFDF